MNVKDYLNKIRTVDALIDCKCDQIAKLRARLLNVTATTEGERVQTSKTDDKFADTIAKIVDLENEINRDIDRLVDLKCEARKLIEKLDDDVQKIVLYKRYFDNKRFEQIAIECNYSWRRINQIHSEALKTLHIIS